MRTLKGWVCERCGSENRLEDTRCLACLHTPKGNAFVGSFERILQGIRQGILDGIRHRLAWKDDTLCSRMMCSAVTNAVCAIRYILIATMIVLTFEAVDVLRSSSVSAAQLWERAAVTAWQTYRGLEMRLESAVITTDILSAYME